MGWMYMASSDRQARMEEERGREEGGRGGRTRGRTRGRMEGGQEGGREDGGMRIDTEMEELS